ncbi:hypothetical protein KIN20_001842 [Parelaphostrongylus tenuis]|uniref:Uncharacterized protein n=1 Tax=Parelaphostrongylus tenuis TaxID=148309 RepID=A0AAD5QHC7_PARTN|nr:hypothetical protein KIN20_001842 [Parelaphostrongylus tenuis]
MDICFGMLDGQLEDKYIRSAVMMESRGTAGIRNYEEMASLDSWNGPRVRIMFEVD